MASKSCDSKIASLIVSLHDDKNMTFESIAKYVKILKHGVYQIYLKS